MPRKSIIAFVQTTIAASALSLLASSPGLLIGGPGDKAMSLLDHRAGHARLKLGF
jgi:hypothetical protein